MGSFDKSDPCLVGRYLGETHEYGLELQNMFAFQLPDEQFRCSHPIHLLYNSAVLKTENEEDNGEIKHYMLVELNWVICFQYLKSCEASCESDSWFCKSHLPSKINPSGFTGFLKE